jgi:hypothetical protein
MKFCSCFISYSASYAETGLFATDALKDADHFLMVVIDP